MHGVPLADVVARVASLRPAKHRVEVVALREGVTLLDDSYNSSPSALRQALEIVARDHRHARKVAVLGEMLELGAFAQALHVECGHAAVRAGVSLLVTVGGPPAEAMAGAARDAGLDERAAVHVESSAEAADRLLARPRAERSGAREGLPWHRYRPGGGAPAGGVELMLYHLLYSMHSTLSVLNVTRYITFRTAAASLTALVLSLLLGPWMIGKLRAFQIGQVIRHEGPASHRAKAGTPTMGGLLILTAALVPTLLWADLTNVYVWIAVTATALFGAIGFADDYLKITRRSHHGLLPRYKMGAQLLVAARRRRRRARAVAAQSVQHAAHLPVLQVAHPRSGRRVRRRSPSSCSWAPRTRSI